MKTIAALALWLSCLSLAAQEIPAEHQAFEGTYVFDAEASDSIDAVVQDMVDRMSWWQRPFAGDRLREVNEEYQRVIISVEPDRVGIAVNRRGYIWTSDNDRREEWVDEEGNSYTVSTEWIDGKLQRTFVSDNGTRVNTYVLSDDEQTLAMHVYITSTQLPEPMTYRLVYRLQSEELRP